MRNFYLLSPKNLSQFYQFLCKECVIAFPAVKKYSPDETLISHPDYISYFFWGELAGGHII